jgi:hypothetical protein
MTNLTEQEQEAINAWLEKNKPKKFPTGYSAIFDEFGNKRAGLKFRLAALSKRIRRVRGYTSMTYVQLAHQLAVNADEVMAACIKHNIPTADR